MKFLPLLIFASSAFAAATWFQPALLAQDNGENGRALAEAIIAKVEQEADPDFTVEIQKELCDDNVTTEVPDLSTGSFTVAIRAQILEQGAERGNDPGNLGMVFSVATGYNDGFRVYYNWHDRRFTFQIGKPGGASGCTSEFSYAPGIMRDIVAVCDAYVKTFTLYIDGKKAASAPLDTEFFFNGEPLKVGFAGAGVGSNRMYVDKIEYWSRPLVPEDIDARTQERDPVEIAIANAVDSVARGGKNVVDLDIASNEDVKTAFEYNIPQEIKDAAAEAETAAALDARNFAEALPAVVKMAEDYVAAKSDAAVQNPTPAQLSAYGKILFRLQAMQNVPPYNKQVKPLISKLQIAYPAEAKVYNKIQTLEESADRVRKIEKDALQTRARVGRQLAVPSQRRVVKVAPDGDDVKGNGSAKAPYASLARAFDDVVAKGPVKAVTVVELAEGTYHVDRTAHLNGVSNVYVRPERNAKVELTGGRAIKNFTTLEEGADPETAQRFNDAVRAKIFVADLSAAGVSDFGKLARRGYGTGDKVNPIPSLYCGGESQTLARWPNDGEETLKFGEIVSAGEGLPESTFKYDYDRVDSWKDVDDLWAFGLYQWEWAANLRKVTKLDREKKEVTFDYANGSGKFDYYYVNVLEELDVPGEYFVDAKAGKLYFYPPQEITTVEELNNAKVEFDEFSDLFVSLDSVSNCIIEGISFRNTRESCAKFLKCDRCYFDDCTIEQIGGNVLTIAGGTCCGMLNSRLREIGACGLRISGGDRDTLTPCKHLMHNNFVSDFSRIDRVYAPAVHAEGCGVAVTNNLMCDSPHHAMRTDGNDMYVARNEVHSCVYEYSDQSGIDIYCDPSYRGIVIEKNLWRHIGSAFALCGQAGIRLDDSISGVIMLDNIFYRSSGGFFGGIQIHGGKDNLAKGNLMVECKQAFSFSPWSDDRYIKFITERFPKYIGDSLYEKTYPFFDEIKSNANRNFILENTAVNCSVFNQNGGDLNVFAGNVRKSAVPDFAYEGLQNTPEEYAEIFYKDDALLKKWLELLAKKSLKDVGLKGKWNGANIEVTPKFRNIEK